MTATVLSSQPLSSLLQTYRRTFTFIDAPKEPTRTSLTPLTLPLQPSQSPGCGSLWNDATTICYLRQSLELRRSLCTDHDDICTCNLDAARCHYLAWRRSERQFDCSAPPTAPPPVPPPASLSAPLTSAFRRQLARRQLASEQVIIYQPAEEAGSYSYRSVSKTACSTLNSCHTLDSLYCADGTRCLKWGSNCYAGRIRVPAGLKVRLYYYWSCSSYKTSVTGYKSQHNFWDYHSRACSFKWHSFYDPAPTHREKL